jgi:hypothetical protein
MESQIPGLTLNKKLPQEFAFSKDAVEVKSGNQLFLHSGVGFSGIVFLLLVKISFSWSQCFIIFAIIALVGSIGMGS